MTLYARIKRKNLLKCVKNKTKRTSHEKFANSPTADHAVMGSTELCASVQPHKSLCCALGHMISSRITGNAKYCLYCTGPVSSRHHASSSSVSR